MKRQSTRKRAQRGQATLELAIYGAVAIVIVTAMINYAQTMALQQEMDMYAYRRALQFSQARYRFNSASRQAEFTAFKETYPLSLLGPDASRGVVSGGAAVDWESDPGTLTGEDPRDFSSQYWQIGERMIRDNQAIEMPRMRVKRKSENDTRNFLANFMEFFTGGGSDEQKVWQAAPIDQGLADNLITAASRENVHENRGAVPTITNSQNVTVQEDNILTYKMQSNAKIMDWDDKIMSIIEKPNDITVVKNEEIVKNRVWETPER